VIPTRPLRAFAVPTAILLIALVVRLSSWTEVFVPSGVRLIGDSDPHYHVLRAERWLHGSPGAPWTDPNLDWPYGADVPWPPLFDGLIAVSARVVFGASPRREQLAAAAAFLPVILGLLLVLLVARTGRRLLGERSGWIAAALVAVLPAATDPTELGRPDQHAAELVLFTGILLGFLAALRPGRTWRAPAVALALLGPLAFWTWMGSALHLLVPLLTLATLHATGWSDDEDGASALRAMAGGGLGGAALLAATVALLGKPGALWSGAATGVGGLHAALLGAAGLFPALLLVARSRRRGPVPFTLRVAELAAAAGLPLAALLAVPTLRAGVVGGWVALRAGNAWYEQIQEFQPLVHPWIRPLGGELLTLLRGLGLVPAVAALGAWWTAVALRADPERTSTRLTLLVALALLVPATILRRRFGAYSVIPIAIAAEAGIRLLGALLAARLPSAHVRIGARGLRALILAALVAPALPEHLASDRTLSPGEEATLAWIAAAPRVQGREAVLAPWSWGHFIQYFCDRPVVSSPFGSEAGPRSLEDTATFWFATSGRAAEAILARRRVGLILLANQPIQPIDQFGHAPPGTPPPFDLFYDLLEGRTIEPRPSYWTLVPNRLFFDDGRGTEAWPPLDGFRLLYESPSTSPDDPLRESQWKVFQQVAGARLGVRTTPGAEVRAATSALSNAGRSFDWEVSGRAGPDGLARLRLPYASGVNGAVKAGPWIVTDGAASAAVVIHEAEILAGAERGLSLLLPDDSSRRVRR